MVHFSNNVNQSFFLDDEHEKDILVVRIHVNADSVSCIGIID